MPILHIDPFSAAAFDAAFDQSVLFNNAKNNVTLKPRGTAKPKRTWQPTGVQIQKTEEAYSIFIDVPGVKQQDMQMQLTGDNNNQTLVLSGIRKFLVPTATTTGGNEVEEAKFEKRFNIGHDVDVEKISADLSSAGVLKITAPKKEVPSPVTIPIQVGPKV
eukprot:CAMPEP_0113625530 /NCGR_PEP_ID=MMETSP0017_2-20120614/13189_1 /TAXON_ID=2856 /ORGANISM="Cylindrotheca closterium" /LENGTH=160 /DNA_ID=CAMNT_0000535651 /DNA_START=98 /DNA_END=580 /DNA_ORIENTATION=+ /assembly_acc=CAM_ASM_000147